MSIRCSVRINFASSKSSVTVDLSSLKTLPRMLSSKSRKQRYRAGEVKLVLKALIWAWFGKVYYKHLTSCVHALTLFE